MINIVCSIGFDLERVHTGLIAYLVDLQRNNKPGPLQSFFHALDVDLQGTGEIKAKKEHENIDLVLCGQINEPLIAIEMKVHNHGSLVAVKGSGGEKDYQTIVYPKRVDECPFLYVTLGVGEYYRQKPYGDVCQVGLDRFLAAVKEVAETDPVIKAWEEALRVEEGFRKACREQCKKGIEDAKKWNLYFLGFLREELESSMSDVCGAYLTVYRISSDTILNSGIKKPLGAEGAYCYMEINGNGKLNLKASLEALSSQGDKQAYVSKVEHHYGGLVKDSFCQKRADDSKNLKNSKSIMSFDIGIERPADKFFTYKEGKQQTCRRIGEVLHWFSEVPPVETG